MKIFSHSSDLTQPSDQPSFPYTLRDLVNWLWSEVTASDYTFRRQCMACLGELCPLLPLPEGFSSSKGKNRRPQHLQAVCDYIYALNEYQNRSETSKIEVAELITINFSLQLSNDYRRFHREFSNVESNEQLSEDLEVRWLESLNGALDGYNWLIKCLTAMPATTLFVHSEGENRNIDQDRKGAKRKRNIESQENSMTATLDVPRGSVLMKNVLFFLQLCCIRLLNFQYKGAQLVSFLQSKLTGRSKRQQYHEKLILEVFRRFLQLFFVLLEADSNYFIQYFRAQGICLENNNELAPYIQFMILCGLGSIDMIAIKNNYNNTIRQRDIINTLDSIADYIVNQIALPDKDFQYHFSKVPNFLSYSEILSDKSILSNGNRSVDELQNEEYTTNIPIAIEQLLLLFSRSNLCHLLTKSLWSTILLYNLDSLTTNSLLPSVLSARRCMSTLKKSETLTILFGSGYEATLQTLGNSLIRATTMGHKFSDRNLPPSPSTIEVGSVLLAMSVDFGIPLVSNMTSSSSLLSMILNLPESPPRESLNYSGESYLQYYGAILVDLIIGTEGQETLFLENCKLFLDMMLHYSKQQQQSINYSNDIVLKRYSLLLEKICTGIVERSNNMKSENLADFILLFSRYIYNESLLFPVPSLSDNIITVNMQQKLFCTRENIGLVLHLNSLLPKSYREDNGHHHNSQLILTIKNIRQFLLQNILYVFNATSDSNLKEISIPLFEGDLCENIIKAFQLLPYIIPGTTTTCPRLYSNSMEIIREIKDEEKHVKDNVRNNFYFFILILTSIRLSQH